MASQSPLASPSDPRSAAQSRGYLDAWQAIGTMLREGRSWSGSERNCCFLNTASSRFADVSAITGLDQVADSRSLAIVDWDHDGDLDLWVSNRTSPRVRFLRNDSAGDHHFVALKLEGKVSNRDAIGARVEVICQGSTRPLRQSRTLRAGEGFLSQSSKWLHFGLGNHEEVERLVVHWPSGDESTFQKIRADRFYRLVEGDSITVVHPKREFSVLKPSTPRPHPLSNTVRLVAHRRLPLPRLEYLNSSGEQVIANGPSDRFRLLVLWATWCRPCLDELSDLADSRSKLEQAKVQVLPLNVDDLAGVLAARQVNATKLLDQIGILDGSSGGLATTETIDALDAVQRCLTTKQDPLVVPSAFLLDAAGRLVICYKGFTAADQVIADVANLSTEPNDPRDSAIPIPGRWFTSPFPPDLLAIPRSLVRIERAFEALNYVQQNVIPPRPERHPDEPHVPESLPQGMDARSLAELLARIGITLTKQAKHGSGITAFQLAIRFNPADWKTHAALATLLQQQGRTRDALSEHRKTLELQPGHPVAINNIAWILATSSDPDLRDPGQAVKQAETVCRLTKHGLPETLDTLAAAYAAAGRFNEAVETAGRAFELAESQKKNDKANQIRKRLGLYKSKRTFIDKRPAHHVAN